MCVYLYIIPIRKSENLSYCVYVCNRKYYSFQELDVLAAQLNNLGKKSTTENNSDRHSGSLITDSSEDDEEEENEHNDENKLGKAAVRRSNDGTLPASDPPMPL